MPTTQKKLTYKGPLLYVTCHPGGTGVDLKKDVPVTVPLTPEQIAEIEASGKILVEDPPAPIAPSKLDEAVAKATGKRQKKPSPSPPEKDPEPPAKATETKKKGDSK